MIVAELREGLGNQMFQYAAARRLAAMHNTSLRLDVSWFESEYARTHGRNYELHLLRVSGMALSQREAVELRRASRASGTERSRRSSASSRPLLPCFERVTERHHHFDPDILRLPNNSWLFGFWNSEKYFAESADVIRAEFALRDAPSVDNANWIRQMSEGNSVAVHVRRGDYLRSPASDRQGCLDVAYYHRAAGCIAELVPDPVFYVFSDDPNWARANLALPGAAHFVDNNQGEASTEDLRLMTSCRHNIIANSTYSWWGAWLSPTPDQIVIGPRRWMVDPSFDCRDVLPSRWRTI